MHGSTCARAACGSIHAYVVVYSYYSTSTGTLSGYRYNAGASTNTVLVLYTHIDRLSPVELYMKLREGQLQSFCSLCRSCQLSQFPPTAVVRSQVLPVVIFSQEIASMMHCSAIHPARQLHGQSPVSARSGRTDQLTPARRRPSRLTVARAAQKGPGPATAGRKAFVPPGKLPLVGHLFQVGRSWRSCTVSARLANSELRVRTVQVVPRHPYDSRGPTTPSSPPPPPLRNPFSAISSQLSSATLNLPFAVMPQLSREGWLPLTSYLLLASTAAGPH